MNESDADWNEFSSALAFTMAGMPEQAYLVIGAIGASCVRVHVDKSGISCEVVNKLGDDYRARVSAESVLEQHGWQSPVEGGAANWHCSVRWPAYYREYEVVADGVVAALSQVLQIGKPAELSINSWIRDSDEVFGTVALRAALGR